MGLKYRSDIDGLRAIAVIPVILFHVGFETFSGGYSGVDVFFVISGYLITSIIYSEFKEDKFSIITFYERRARRILPLLFFILLITLPFAWMSLFQTDMVDYFKSLIAVPTFFSNILFTSEADYFDTAVELKPLLHTWSLAVEEQYYIFFPLFIMLFFKINKTDLIFPLILFFCIISFILSEWASINYPKHNFYLLPSRVWELGIGAIVAILFIDRNPILFKIKAYKIMSETFGILGFILIISGYFIINSDSPFPSSYTLFPVFGSALILAFSSNNSVIGKLISIKPLLYIGLFSYSAYLWHHPFFAFIRHLGLYENTFLIKFILSIIVIPLSYLSWRFIENPFRNKEKFGHNFIFKYSLIGSLFFIVIGIIGVLSNGFPNRQINKTLNILNYSPDNRQLQLDSWKELRLSEQKLNNNDWFEIDNEKTNLLLIGNSHSKDIYNVLKNSKVAQENFNIGQVGGEILDFTDRKHLVYSSNNYLKSEIVFVVSRYRKEDIPVMENFIKILLKDRKKVVIVKEIHNFIESDGKTNADLIVQKYIREGNKLDDESKIKALEQKINKVYYGDYLENHSELKLNSDQVIDSIKVKYPEIILLDRMDYVCDGTKGSCFAINSKLEKFFFDYGHHTVEGSKAFGERVDMVNWLDPLFEN